MASSRTRIWLLAVLALVCLAVAIPTVAFASHHAAASRVTERYTYRGTGAGGASLQYTARLEDAKVTSAATGDNSGAVSVTRIAATQTCPNQTVQVPADSAGVPVTLRCTGTVPPSHYMIAVYPHGRLKDVNLQAGTFTYVPPVGYRGRAALLYRPVSAGVAGLQAEILFDVGESAPSGATSSGAVVTASRLMRVTRSASQAQARIKPGDDFPVELKVTGLPRASELELKFKDADFDPVAGDGGALGVNGDIDMEWSKDSLLALTVEPTELTLEEPVTHTGSGDTLSGTASVPSGATLTIEANRRAPVVIRSGSFSIPL